MKRLSQGSLIMILLFTTALVAGPEKPRTGKGEPPATTDTGADPRAKQPEEIIKIFFELFRSRGPASAVDYIFSNNPYIYERQESVGALKEKISQLGKMLGKEHGAVLIQDRQFAETIRVISYLVKFDRQPLRFTFVFYKADNRWTTYQFNFDDAMDDATMKQAQSIHFESVVQ